MNKKYDYVPKNEVKPYREIFQEWMKCIRKTLKEEGISFTYVLVGSAKRNLVIRHHNKGFDCDYQIRIMKNMNNLNAKSIKMLFINELNKIVGDNGFNDCADSTSAITIRKLGDKNNVKFSYDVVILRENADKIEILRNSKETGQESDYKFEALPEMTNARKNFHKINGNTMWKLLREKYYNKQMSYKYSNKKSFQILNEAVNEVLKEFL